MSRPRVLIAQDANTFAPIERALESFELLKATTFFQAQKMIAEDNIALFVIGIHFDESRCMDLIREIRLGDTHTSTPIVVVRLLPSANPDMLRSTMDAMKAVHGITDYIEDHGQTDVEARIRDAVERAIKN